MQVKGPVAESALEVALCTESTGLGVGPEIKSQLPALAG